ncbi:MAG: response regulator [Alphaproteobacteria bacterium]
MNDISAIRSNLVLLVEDNPEVREFVVRALNLFGYATIEAEDGVSALAKLQERADIRLLLTDVMLPGGLNGAELARRALEFRADLKVLFVSGYGDAAIDGKEMRRLGATMLAKPFRLQELQERLLQVVGG